MSITNAVADDAPLTRPADVGFWEAFRLWLKLGFMGFGGPAAQIALMHRELVEQRRWISERRFCMPLTIACCSPARRRSSSPLTWVG